MIRQAVTHPCERGPPQRRVDHESLRHCAPGRVAAEQMTADSILLIARNHAGFRQHMRARVNCKEAFPMKPHQSLWRLPGLLVIYGVLLFMSHDSAAVATFSTNDLSWPIDARTAFQMFTPGGEPMGVSHLEWTGKFYNGEPGSIPRFHFRVYDDSDGVPGNVIAERTINSFSTTEAEEGELSYTASIQTVTLPAGTAVWAEIQAEAPAIPQWGLVTIQSLPLEDMRLVLCPELGFLIWSEYTELEVPRGGVPQVHLTSTGTQYEAGGLRDIFLGPNPTAGPQILRFSVRQNATIKGTIHDLGGRRVRTLFARSFSAGQHSITWDGRTDGGMACGQGIYFLRLADETGTVVHQKVMIVKEVSR